MNDLQNAKERLLSGGYTCVLCRGEREYTSLLRGVRPLVQWLQGGIDLRGFAAADKVVGKATAFLYVRLGVKAVYASVISRAARQVLKRYGIAAEYGLLVDCIVNRKGNGPCPFEAAVTGIDEASEAYEVILHKMQEMNIPIESVSAERNG